MLMSRLVLTALLLHFAVNASADPLVVTGRIWTGTDAQPWVEAVAIDGDRIIDVGSRDEVVARLGEEAKVIDAGGGIVVPGMYDSHIHLIDGGARLASVQLRDAKTPEEFAKRIGDFAAEQRAKGHRGWITGGDWDHTHWGGELPDRKWIDAVTPDTPVFVSRLDGHMALANTAALKAAGVEEDVEDVDGGEIVRDAAGRVTGVLKDNAMDLVYGAIPPESVEQRLEAVRAAMAYMAQRGITSVHHMGSWHDVAVFRAAKQRGLLTTRVYAFTPLGQWQRLAEEVKRSGRGDDWLKIGGLKGFVDGSLGSHTAAFLQAYTDDPASRGLLVNTAEDLEQWTAGADRAGLQVAVHAIGDRAIRLQLDIFERTATTNGPRDRRFRIEHAQHIAADDIPRFGELGVIPSMQPYHAIDDGRWADPIIGPERSATTYAFRSLIDAKARLALGSDWHVAPATPLEGIDAAVTRRTLDGKNPEGWVPEQKITAEEALRGYTIGAAYAGFEENSRGTLESGKLADLVILDRDILDPDEREIGQTRVMLTMVGGKVVYEREEGK
jgi:predicted amidohydrolase YtcJ